MLRILIRMRDTAFKPLGMCYSTNFMFVQPSLPFAFSRVLSLPLVPLILSHMKTAKPVPSLKSRRTVLEDSASQE